jgi:hypothetical protein
MTFNYYASNHGASDNRFSEQEDHDTYDDAVARAADLRDLWGCEWVNVYETENPAMIAQV